MNSLERAKKILQDEGATLVAVKDGEVYISHSRGVSPILDKIDENPSFFNSSCVADKVVGKAAAMLFVRYRVKEIHTQIISEKALEYLKDKPVCVTYGKTVPHIINRDKTDMCPMEKCVLDITDENEAEKLIRLKRQELLNR